MLNMFFPIVDTTITNLIDSLKESKTKHFDVP